jgi:HK97 gp10 family phage protein
MKFNMDFKGLDSFLSDMTKMTEDKKKEVSDLVVKTAFKVQANAKVRSAVDTAHMKKNIKVHLAPDNMSAKVGTTSEDVEYAPHVEFGTKDTPAQPFLFPAGEEEEPEYNKELQKIFGEK